MRNPETVSTFSDSADDRLVYRNDAPENEGVTYSGTPGRVRNLRALFSATDIYDLVGDYILDKADPKDR